ncbi:MAG: hypothetical protein RLZZ611_437 [Cyanobacteriota bacterium]
MVSIRLPASGSSNARLTMAFGRQCDPGRSLEACWPTETGS